MPVDSTITKALVLTCICYGISWLLSFGLDLFM
jgi:hypothetical protein